MKWLRWDTNSDSHPQIRAAGFWGARVFEVLCRLSGEFDLGGRLLEIHTTPALLADRLQAREVLGDATDATLRNALQRCVVAGLVSSPEEGIFTLAGWERFQGENSTERSRKCRKLKANPSATNATLRNVAATHDTVRNETKEKKKREKKEPSEVASRVLARINDLAGTKYRSSPELDARVSEGTPESDLMAVVESLGRDPFWLSTVHLKPSALFRPTKFPEYLGAAGASASAPRTSYAERIIPREELE